jgi:Holliday junction resolvasome RuvABC endonuclease subunit
MTILLALDPSTDVTGAALFDLEGDAPHLIAYTAFDAFTLSGQPRSRAGMIDRLERIAKTRHELAVWLTLQEVEPAYAAYETQSGRGHASSEALVMAVGAYLTISRLVRVPPIEVNRSAACAAVGASKVYAQPAGATNQERDEKRRRLKQAVICGVNSKLGLSLREDQDAEADAIAVGLAGAAKIVLAEKMKKGKKK